MSPRRTFNKSRLHQDEQAVWMAQRIDSKGNCTTFNSNYMEGGYSSSWEGGEGHDHDECIFKYAEQSLQRCLSQRCKLLLFETGNRRPFNAKCAQAEHLSFLHFASVCGEISFVFCFCSYAAIYKVHCNRSIITPVVRKRLFNLKEKWKIT